jgi:hypothetical protein
VNARREFRPEYGVQRQVAAHVRNITTAFPAGLTLKLSEAITVPRAGFKHSMDTKVLKIDAEVAIKSDDPAEAAQWTLGFVQAVTRLNRVVNIAEKQRRGVWTWSIAAPHKDGPAGDTTVWFDPSARVALAATTFQVVERSMMDRPGFKWSNEPDVRIERVSGGDSFKTWLVLRRNNAVNAGQTLFLRMWEWHVTYGIDSQAAAGGGISLDRTEERPDGNDCVWSGSNCKEVIAFSKADLPP